MISSSDYSFVDRWLHVVSALGLIAYYLYSYNQLPSLRNPQLKWIQDHKFLAFAAIITALAALFLFDIVAVVVKYKEGYLGLPIGAATPTAWVTKPTDLYSSHSKALVAFTDFLINVFWSARIAVFAYFSSSFLFKGSPAYPLLNVAVLTHFISFFVLQIVLDSVNCLSWEIPQWIFAIEFFGLSIWFLVSYISLRKNWAAKESLASLYTPFEIQCAGWISLLIAIEAVSFTILSIGAANKESTEESYEYFFESKAAMDFFLFCWNLALTFGFIAIVIHMFHDSELFTVGEATVANMRGSSSANIPVSVPGRADKRDTSSARAGRID